MSTKKKVSSLLPTRKQVTAAIKQLETFVNAWPEISGKKTTKKKSSTTKKKKATKKK